MDVPTSVTNTRVFQIWTVTNGIGLIQSSIGFHLVQGKWFHIVGGTDGMFEISQVTIDGVHLATLHNRFPVPRVVLEQVGWPLSRHA